MDIPPQILQLTWIDWAILLILLAYVVAGIRRGFVMGVLDLVGMVVSLGAAVLGYRQVSAFIHQSVDVPKAVAILGAFLGLVAVTQLIYSALVNILFHLGRRLTILFGPLSLLDRALGTLPGLVKGAIFATLALLPFALYPLVPDVSATIERSTLGSKMVVAAIDAAPRLESILGRELNEGLAFLTPAQTEEGMKINFGLLGKLEPDPAAEQQMLDLLNAERAKAGLRPVQFDEHLRDVGRLHSLEMFQLGYFGHNSPTHGSPFDRMKQAEIAFVLAGENLAYAPNVQIAHEGLMNSPGHKANILRPEFGHLGIGVIKSEFRGSMFSQEFTN